jgi:serine phosphatase RsbU (regulator of sigma subunit)
MAICQIDLSSQSLIFAGAKRPLYLYQKTTNQLLKIVGDKKSIGGRQKEIKRHFTDHHVKFSNGDTLYMNSDGFVDQHNADGKKFGSLKLEALLQDIGIFDAASQKQQLIKSLDKHQENESQRDDITLIGVKFKV